MQRTQRAGGFHASPSGYETRPPLSSSSARPVRRPSHTPEDLPIAPLLDAPPEADDRLRWDRRGFRHIAGGSRHGTISSGVSGSVGPISPSSAGFDSRWVSTW